jgi:beta-galactosidase
LFQAKDGQFWLDDHPILIQAGEFHYFRTPVDQWPHRLGLLQAAGFNAVASYIPWLWHQPTPDISDLDGHSHPMRNLAAFLDLAADMGFLLIPRPGPYIMAETINEGIPPWVFQQYPAAAFVDQTGKTQNVASYLHPDFLAAIEGWYEAVFAVLAPRQSTRGGKIIMIQLDNEMGMIQWVRNIIDTNPHTVSQFTQYLQGRYGNMLAKRYPAADIDAFLKAQIGDPQPPYGAAIADDYRHFYRGYLAQYTNHLWERAKAYGMEVPPVANIHGFGNGGKTFPIGLSQLVDVMEIKGMISATDVYPGFIGEGNFHQLVLVNEMTKALHNPEQPLFSIEFQSGGGHDFGGAQSSLYDLHTRLCVSCGMRAVNHYLFFDGENDPILSPVKRHDWGHPVRKDGTLRRSYARYAKLSNVLTAYGEDLIRSQPKTVATIGFLLDAFMTEVNNPLSRPMADVLTHQRDTVLFDFIGRGLALTQRPFKALELTRHTLDPKQTPIMFAFMEKTCDAATQEKLVGYVRQGGTLVLAGRLCQQTPDQMPCTILQQAFGIHTVTSTPPFTPGFIHAFHYRDIPASFIECFTGDFDEIFATDMDGNTVGFAKQLGTGRLLFLGAAFPTNTLDDLDVFSKMAFHVGCSPLFTLSDWVDIRLSEGEKGDFLFLNNYQDDPIQTTIARAGIALFGGHPIVMPARSGLILPLEWQARPGIHIYYITSEITALRDQNGHMHIYTAQPEFFAEIRLNGYRCEEALISKHLGENHYVLQGKTGVIVLEPL